MTFPREQIIEWAVESGIPHTFLEAWSDDYARFAKLIEQAARADEREACTKVCDAQIERWNDDRARYCASECAAAIRARSNQ